MLNEVEQRPEANSLKIGRQKMDKSRNLHHLLDELIRTHNLEPKILEQKVFALWREYLGTPLGTGTVPVSLSNGTLKIYTEYSAYITELSLLKQRIIDDLNAKLGQPVLTDFRIELRPARATKPHETENRSANLKTSKENSIVSNQVPPEQLEKIEQALASVLDPQLKNSLWQLFMTQSKEKP